MSRQGFNDLPMIFLKGGCKNAGVGDWQMGHGSAKMDEAFLVGRKWDVSQLLPDGAEDMPVGEYEDVLRFAKLDALKAMVDPLDKQVKGFCPFSMDKAGVAFFPIGVDLAFSLVGRSPGASGRRKVGEFMQR